MKNKRILVVDDEQGMCELLEIILQNEGYTVDTAPNVEEACSKLSKSRFDAVVTDLRIGSDKNAGMSLLTWIEDNSASTPSIMMTAHGSIETAIDAMKRGATDYIMKPFKNDEIKLIIKRAIQQNELLRENKALKKEQAKMGEVRNMIGTSQVIETVRDMIRKVALLPSTIAIHGESGTGKELVARGIHQLSDRAEKAFIAINCGGIPENLLESELFGHVKGSFTGAHENKDGLFVAADGGTLFLDEIGEMPLALQVKLLRVLDNNVLTPVGGTDSIPVDVRIVSATNRNLEALSQSGEFREDLYYRLNVIPISLPPLRERKEDIPLLVHHFINTHCEKLGRPHLDIPDEVMEVLTTYRWPGNVRELGNMLERAVALSTTKTIALNELPKNILQFMPEPVKHITELPEEGTDMEVLVENLEIGLIQQALRKTNHSQTKAAALLGLSTRSFRYRLKKYALGNGADEE